MSTTTDKQDLRPSQRSSSAVVTQRLARMLAQGLWPTGARLPSTRELSERFNANRATVQRALRVLAGREVVECRPRSGWYVRGHADNTHDFDTPADGTTPVMQIGLTCPGTSSPAALRNRLGETWVGSIAAGARDTLETQQVDLLMLAGGPEGQSDPKPFFDRIDQLGAGLGGVVAIQPLTLAPIYDGLRARDMPWVVVDRPETAFTHNFVSADNFGDCFRLGYLLGKIGYEKIFVLSGNPSVTPSCDEKTAGMISGYCRATNRCPQLTRAICEDSGEEIGYNRARQLLKSHGTPDVIFCSGDKLAIGAMKACQNRGLRIPQDVAVVGTTGLEISQYTQPTLTVVTQPGHMMGAAAADMLLTMAANGVRQLPGRCIRGELIIRESLPVSDELLEQLNSITPQYPWRK